MNLFLRQKLQLALEGANTFRPSSDLTVVPLASILSPFGFYPKCYLWRVRYSGGRLLQVEAFTVQCSSPSTLDLPETQVLLPLTLDTDAHWPAEHQGLHHTVCKGEPNLCH